MTGRPHRKTDPSAPGGMEFAMFSSIPNAINGLRPAQDLSARELEAIRDSVAFVGRLSDSIVRVGPFSLGVDGVLSWIPAVGEVYSAAAGGFILVQGARAGVPTRTLAAAGLLLGVRTLGNVVPLAGALFADVFTAHRWAARMVVEAIDRRLNLQGAGVATTADVPPSSRRPSGRPRLLSALRSG